MNFKPPAFLPTKSCPLERASWWGIGVIFLILALAWMFAPATREEAFSDSFRWPDGFSKIFPLSGPAWWNPAYMLGQPMATYYFSPLAMGCLWLGTVVLSPILSALVSFRIVVVIFALVGAVGMGALMRRITENRWAVLVACGLYLMMPFMMVRGAVYEHSIQFMCFVFMLSLIHI